MKHAMANRRRNRNDGRGGGGGGNGPRPMHNKATVFDSNGPDVRIRGTAFQIVEKYLTLAKDSASSGDRVLAENYLQHAEHYQRMINTWAEEAPQPRFRDREPMESLGDDSVGNTEAPMVISRPAAQPKVEEDLGLPASILGRTPATDLAVAD